MATGCLLPLTDLRGRPGFKIAHLNVRSLVGKINQLRLDLPNSSLDILSVSETWLTANTEDRLATVQNYDLIRHDRQVIKSNGQVKTGGGLGIYHKDTLDVDPSMFRRLNLSTAELELQWVVISRPNTKRILLGNVYRPPEGSVNEAFELIGAALDEIDNITKFEIMIIGDFNADNLNKTGQHYQKIRSFEAEHQLQQLITVPTRFAKTSQSTIDLAFTNMKYCTSAGTINYNISDHKLIYVIKKKPRNCKAVETHMGRSYTNCTDEAMIESFSAIDTQHIYEI